MHIPEHPILLAPQFSRHIFVVESLHVAINTAVHRPNVEILVAQQLFQGICHLTARQDSK